MTAYGKAATARQSVSYVIEFRHAAVLSLVVLACSGRPVLALHRSDTGRVVIEEDALLTRLQCCRTVEDVLSRLCFSCSSPLLPLSCLSSVALLVPSFNAAPHPSRPHTTVLSSLHRFMLRNRSEPPASLPATRTTFTALTMSSHSSPIHRDMSLFPSLVIGILANPCWISKMHPSAYQVH